MSSDTNTELFISKVPTAAAAKVLNSLFTQLGVTTEWDGGPLEVSRGDTDVRGYARDLSVNDFTGFSDDARLHKLCMVAHFDFTPGACEGSIAAQVYWVDGVTGKSDSYASEMNTFAPVFTVSDAVKIAKTGSHAVAEIMAAIGQHLPAFVLGLIEKR